MAVFTWKGGTALFDGGNWEPNGQPGPTDIADVYNQGTLEGDGRVDELNVSGPGAVEFDASADIAVDSLSVYQNNLGINGGSIVIFDAGPGSLFIGGDNEGSSPASVELTAGGGLLDAGTGTISAGVLTVEGLGSSLYVSTLLLGTEDGSGSLYISGGAIANVVTCVVGAPFVDSEVSISGSGSELSIRPGVSEGLITVLTVGSGEQSDSTFDVTNGARVTIGGSVGLGSSSSISVDNTSAMEIGGESNLVTGMIVIDTGASISGSGSVEGNVDNEGGVFATGGTLAITGAITGAGTMTVGPSLSDLTLYGSVSRSQTVFFADSSGPIPIGGIMSIGDIENFSGIISNFTAGDEIDLLDVPFPSSTGDEGLEANFDSTSGILSIDEVLYGVGVIDTYQLQFSGYAPDQTFSLSSDGDGGTDISIGTAAPDLLTLALLDNVTYTYGSYTGPVPYTSYAGGYTIVDGTSDSAGLLMDAFEDGNQLVIAIRGTDPNHLYDTIKNLLADASWLPGSLGLPAGNPNSILAQEVTDAAEFLASVRALYPDEQITLTGHSLGGAVAQLLGNASGYTTVGFNAPGAAQFEHGLESNLLPAKETADGMVGRNNENFRLEGDQVSLTGTPIGGLGNVWTLLNSPYSGTWLNALDNHSLDTIVGVIEQGQTSTTTVGGITGVPSAVRSGEPDSALPLSELIQPVSEVLAAGANILGIAFAVTVASVVGGVIAAFYAIDPGSASSYQLVGNGPSPDFSAFSLPAYSGVASYDVSFLVNGVWQANQSIIPEQIFDAPTGDTGIQYSARDANGDTVNLPDGYIIDAAFATTGTFTGTLTETLACFRSGTQIMTATGPVAVELLRKGDLVAAQLGGCSSIKWIGHRQVDCHHHPDPRKVWPVRVSAGAFMDGMPNRDLWLSPDHAVFAGGVLIPIKRLINDTTITQVPVDEVTYYHIELACHDLLLAEGIPTESYLDTGNRSNFANGGGSIELHPDFSLDEDCEAIWEAAGCAPLRIDGKGLDLVAEQIRRRSVELGNAYASKKRQRSGRRSAKSIDLAQLLNPSWYLANNQDVADAGVDASLHYANWGLQEGRLPCDEVDFVRALGLVDAGTVLFTMDDVVAAGLDPVRHFCSFGWRERRRPNPYFHTGWYMETQDVPAGMNPLLHYVLLGEPRGLLPSRHFDPAWYRKRYSIGPSMSPMAHYLKHRRTQRFSPLPAFDAKSYIQTHATTIRPDRDPYAHYLAIGRFVGRGAKQVTAVAA